MNSRFLETFMWLATLKSFKKTADRLNVSQPVVSTRIATLEKQLGVDLYHHGARNFQLTPIGRRILEKAEGIVQLSNELAAIVATPSATEKPIRIGIPEIVALTWLPQLLEGLDEAFPSVPIDIRTYNAVKPLADDVRTGALDVAFVVGTASEPGLVDAHICQFPVHWVASPKRFDTEREISISELAELPIIVSPKFSYRHERMLEYFRLHNIIDPAGASATHSFDGGFGTITSARLAAHGLGVTALPVMPIRELLVSGELAILNVRQAFMPWHVAACYQATGSALGKAVVSTAQEVVRAYMDTTDRDFFRL